MRTITKALKKFFGFEARVARQQNLRNAMRLHVESMEDRVVPAALSDLGGTTLTIALSANESLGIVSNGPTYGFTTNQSFTNPGAAVVAAGDFSSFGGTSLTLQASGLVRYDTINIVDAGTNARVTFNGSGVNAYSDNLSVVLDDPGAGAITFNGATSLTGANALEAATSKNILANPGSSISTDSGDITLEANQQTTATTGNFNGIEINGGSLGTTIGSTSGNITLKGRSGTNWSGAHTDGHGIYIRGNDGGAPAAVVGQGTTGTVTLVGTGSWTGVHIGQFGTATVTSGGGDVSVTGFGSHAGVYVYAAFSPATITAGGTGTVTVAGTGTGSGHNSHGVVLNNYAVITSGGGDISVTGIGGGSGASRENYGIYLYYSTITAGGSGTVTVVGQGGNTTGTGGAGSNIGVNFYGTSTINSSGGDVSVTGTGGGTAGGGNFNTGVSVGGGGRISAGGLGAVTVDGTGGNTAGTIRGDANHGVDVDGAFGGTITSGGGNVSVTGTGGGNAASYASHGVRLWNSNAGTPATSITAGGSGTVTVVGYASDLSMDSQGVVVASNTRITSGGGDVSVTGTAGSGQGNLNIGVLLDDRGAITAGGTGTVTVVGTGGSSSGTQNHGVQVGYASFTELAGTITSSGGDVSVTGTSGPTAGIYGIKVRGQGVISTSASGNVMLTADTIDLGGSINAQTRTVNIQPMTAGRSIYIGTGSPVAGSLWLRNSSLGSGVTAGTINIGKTDAGTITVGAPVTRTAATDLYFTTAATTSVRPSASGTDLNLVGGALAISAGSDVSIDIGGTVVDSGYTQLKVNGTVNLAGLGLALSGGYTPQPGNVFTVVSASSITGTFAGLADNATVAFNGRSLRVNYTATTVTLTDAGPSNQPPAVARDGAAVAVQKFQTATNTGTFSDPDGNSTVTLSASLGTVTKDDGAGTWSWSAPTNTLALGAQTVTITATDNFGVTASTSFTLTVNKADQSISFGTLADKTYGDGSFTVSASASSGLPVSFTVIGGPATISGNAVTITGAGTVVIRSTQGGDDDYSAAVEVDQSFTVAKADASIILSGYTGGTYDGSAHTQTVTVTGIAGDGELFADSLTGTNANSYSKGWSFSSDNYNTINGTLAFTIAKADATASVTGYTGGTYDGSFHTQTVTVTGIASDGELFTVSLSGANAGDYSEGWSFSSGNYNLVSGTLVFTIAKAASVTTTIGAGPFTYDGATQAGGSGTVSGVGGLISSDVTLTYTGDQINAGTYYVTAHYPGDANHEASDGQAVAITIVPVAATVSGNVVVLSQAANALTVSGNAQLHPDGDVIVHGTDTLAVLSGLSGSSTTAVNVSGNMTVTLNPGSYASISVSGNARLILNPGIYIIGTGGITLSGNAVVTSSGLGVLLYNNGALTVSGNASVDLTALSTGNYANVAIFQARTNASVVTISGNATLNLHNSFLYQANTQSKMTITGNAHVNASLMVNELTLSGNALVD